MAEVDKQNRVLAIVCMALNVLVRRCLVFRLAPMGVDSAEAQLTKFDDGEPMVRYNKVHRDEADEKDKNKPQMVDNLWRFTLHRFTQRAIFRRLQAPFVEHPHVDPFGLSMWVTQPDDLPRPNRAAIQQISAVVAEWTGFPLDNIHIESQSAFHHARTRAKGNCETREKTLAARLLHAALGVVRSVYSVGVVWFPGFTILTTQRGFAA